MDIVRVVGARKYEKGKRRRVEIGFTKRMRLGPKRLTGQFQFLQWFVITATNMI